MKRLRARAKHVGRSENSSFLPAAISPLPCKQGRGRPFAALAAASLAALTTLAHADTTAADLRTAAEQAVRTQYGSTGNRVVIMPTRLNPRLHFAACPHALQTRLPMRQGVRWRK